jgi:hypothetical protein
MMTCGALNSRSLSILRNPNNAPYSGALWTFRVIAHLDYVLVSPFFLLSAKVFFPAFFLSVQLTRTDDLHLLQFFTNPALKIHNPVYLLFVCFEKNQLFNRLDPEDKRNSSLRSVPPH